MIKKVIILNNKQYEKRLKKQEKNFFTSAIKVKDKIKEFYYEF